MMPLITKQKYFSRLLLIISCILSCTLIHASAFAATSSKQRLATFAKLPDWSGIWEPAVKWSGGLNGRGDRKGPPPNGWAIDAAAYNPEWLAKSKAASAAAGRNDSVICAFGFPAVMNNLLMFEALITPEETALIFSRREIRHIYTNGLKQPPEQDLWPTPWGSSVGRWEGDTLVIDTIFVQDGKNPSKFSPQARFTERMRMVKPDLLETTITVNDPLALLRPVSTTFQYSRVTDFDRMVHDDCQGNDRFVSDNGQLKLPSP
ncbi:MAG: hypothetical protein QM808_03145 [Steroidobacteraceae bacterium]